MHWEPGLGNGWDRRCFSASERNNLGRNQPLQVLNTDSSYCTSDGHQLQKHKEFQRMPDSSHLYLRSEVLPRSFIWCTFSYVSMLLSVTGFRFYIYIYSPRSRGCTGTGGPRGATPLWRSGRVAVGKYPSSKLRSSDCTLLEQLWIDTPCQR